MHLAVLAYSGSVSADTSKILKVSYLCIYIIDCALWMCDGGVPTDIAYLREFEV